MSSPKNLYFDYQASTPLDPRVRSLMASISDTSFANPHADDHAQGWNARAIIDQARQQIAESVGALPDEIIFTSGATEADNIGVLGAALGAPDTRRRILVSEMEHKAVLESAFSARAFGFTVDLIPSRSDGIVDLEWLRGAVGRDVAVISVMAVNNEIGTLQPVGEVSEIGNAVGAFVHTDATQGPAALEIDLLKWNVDAASFSSHKVYGPKGVGALYLAGSAPWRPRPLMFGGGQEQGLRPGTLPTELCAGFGLAMTLMTREDREVVAAKRARFLTILEAGLSNLTVTCAETPRHPGNLHVRLPGLDAKDLITRLQPRLSASTGSACTSGIIAASHVLKSLGFSDGQANEGLRLSVGRFTTNDEIDEGADIIVEAVKAISPS